MNIFLGTWIKKEVVLAKGGGGMKLKFKRRAAGAQKVENLRIVGTLNFSYLLFYANYFKKTVKNGKSS